MSFFATEVIELPTPEPHPNGENLWLFRLKKPMEVTVVGNKQSWEGKTKAALILPDSVCPNTSEFEFLGSSRRVTARKLRGVLSYGMLWPVPDDWQVGEDVSERLGIKKYEPSIKQNVQSATPPEGAIKYTDIENVRKYGDIFQSGETVHITEKVDGTSARFVYQNDFLHVGSRNCWLSEDEKGVYRNVAKDYMLSDKLSHAPNMMLCGEIYGSTNHIKYFKGNKFLAYDVYDVTAGKFLDFYEFGEFCARLDIPTVPLLYSGPWVDFGTHYKLTEENSRLYDGFMEGIVCRPDKERYDETLGRVILKTHSERYLQL